MPVTIDLPPALLERVQRELDDHETLLWAAPPDPRRMGRRMLPILLIGIPFTLIALVSFLITFGMGLLAGALTAGLGLLVGLVFSSCSLIFVLVGVAMLTAPLWARRAAGQTAYAVTDRRAIIFGSGFRRTVRSFAPEQLTDIERVDLGDGRGDLIFQRQYRYHHGHHHGATVHVTPIGFFGIPHVDEVARLLRELAAAHR